MTRSTTSTTFTTSGTGATSRLLGTGTLAVLLVLAPLCDTVEQVLSPLTTSTTYADIGAISAHESRFVASALVGILGTLLFVPALLGLTDRTVHRAPVASRIAAGLSVVGLTCFMGIRLGQAVELQGVRDGLPRRTTADLVDHLGANPLGAVIVGAFLIGTVVGLLAVAVAVWRSGLPRPAAVLIVAFGVGDNALEGAVPGWAMHALLLVGLTWVAVALVRSERTTVPAALPAPVAA